MGLPRAGLAEALRRGDGLRRRKCVRLVVARGGGSEGEAIETAAWTGSRERSNFRAAAAAQLGSATLSPLREVS